MFKNHLATLSDLVGQPTINKRLDFAIKVYKKKREQGKKTPFETTMFTGASGLGKTLTANILHNELDNRDPDGNRVRIKDINGTQISSNAQLVSLLLNAKDHDTIFFDESHMLSKEAQNLLLTVIEKRIIEVNVAPTGENGATSETLDLSNFTLILATTDLGQMIPALRGRFGASELVFKPYTTDYMTEILQMRLAATDFSASKDVLDSISYRACNIPRTAILYLYKITDMAMINDVTVISESHVNDIFSMLEIDKHGFKEQDLEYLKLLKNNKEVALSVLAGSLNIAKITITETIEPALFKRRLITKTDSSKRSLTPEGRRILETSAA